MFNVPVSSSLTGWRVSRILRPIKDRRSAMKPVVLVTRKLPAAVEDRLRRDYQARLNPDDHLYSSDALIESAAGADAILPCSHGALLGAGHRKPPQDRAYHRELLSGIRPCGHRGGETPWAGCDQHPDVLSDAHGRGGHDAHAGRSPACRRRGASGADPNLAGLEPQLHGGYTGDRQAARHCGPWACRPGHGTASPGV